MATGNERTGPLLERQHELGMLREAIASASDGRGSVVLVEGPAGIGKTRLLAAAASAASDAAFLVRQARGGEIERDMPFGLVRQLFEPLIERATEEELAVWFVGSARQSLAALGRLDADVGEIDVLTAVNGLYWFVANLAEARPILMIMDDAHWSDVDSLRFVSFLARRITDLPVCVVLGARTGEADEPSDLNALRLECATVRPGPLTASSVHELIAIRTGQSPTAGFSAACASVTGGNPFLIVEMLRELGSLGAELDAAAIEWISKLAPENVARSVLFRLGRFGEEAVALARAIAVLGRAPQLRHAARLARLDDDVAATLCDRLRDAEILAPGLPLDFVHPVVRQAIYQEESEARRSATHRRAAEVLSSTGARPVDVASHLLACAPNGDEWVVDRLRAAAEVAMKEAGYASAVKYLERALKEPPADPTPLLLLSGSALVEVDPFRAPIVLREAVDRAPDAEVRLEALRQLVWAHLSTGNLFDAANTCDEALVVAGGRDGDVRLALEAQRFFMRSAAQGIDRNMAEEMARIAAGLSGRTPGERVVRQAHAIARFMECAPVEEVVGLCLPFPDPPWEIGGGASPVPFAAAKLLAWSGRGEVARLEIMRWVDVVTEQGRPISVSVANSFLAEIERLTGQLADSESSARTAWDIAKAAPRFTSFGWSSWMNLAATLLARGDLEAFDHLIGEFELSAGPLEVPLNPWPIEIRAQLRAIRGQLELAVEDYLALGSTLEDQIGWLNPLYPPWRQEATEALAALGRNNEARQLIAVAEKRTVVVGSSQGMATVLRARSFTETRTRAIESLRQSVSLLDAHGPPHELARSLVELGSALRRNGERSESKEPLKVALETAHRCGARGIERRAREGLRAVGSRPRRAARTGVAALTAAELKIARLAGGGLNNREIAERLFVTRRTVETHLTHVYEKLGISGRGELAASLTETS